MEIIEEQNARYYNGLPSVTTVLDVLNEPWLSRWRGKVGNEEADRITKQSAWIGTLFHDTISAWETSGATEPIDTSLLDMEVATLVEQYVQWKSTTVTHWTLHEIPIVSKELGFGGTPDRVGVLNYDSGDCLTLVDFKTGKPSRKHELQTAGYKLLLEYTGVHIARRVALYIPSTISSRKSITAQEHNNHKADLDAFIACLNLYNYLKSHKGGNVND